MTPSQPAADAPDGIVTLPRRAPFWAMCALFLGMAGQIFWFGSYSAGLENRLTGLAESDQRAATNSDERFAVLKGRLDSLERDRDRLPKLEERFGRIEEKMTMMLELLRETRAEGKRRPPG